MQASLARVLRFGPVEMHFNFNFFHICIRICRYLEATLRCVCYFRCRDFVLFAHPVHSRSPGRHLQGMHSTLLLVNGGAPYISALSALVYVHFMRMDRQ